MHQVNSLLDIDPVVVIRDALRDKMTTSVTDERPAKYTGDHPLTLVVASADPLGSYQDNLLTASLTVALTTTAATKAEALKINRQAAKAFLNIGGFKARGAQLFNPRITLLPEGSGTHQPSGAAMATTAGVIKIRPI